MIECKQSLIFKAGAGAGKTYALIESLKHLLEYRSDTLKAHNQKIAVITFTNVAANEVKERLGNSKLVEVSTIHKRLWDLISPYNKQLVAIHLLNLRKELYKENKYIYDNKEFGHLTKEAQNDFIKVMK